MRKLELISLKKNSFTLEGFFQWWEHWPMHWRDRDLIPNQVHVPGLWIHSLPRVWVSAEGNQSKYTSHINIFLSLPLLPSLPFSLSEKQWKKYSSCGLTTTIKIDICFYMYIHNICFDILYYSIYVCFACMCVW